LTAARLILAVDRGGLSWAPEANGEQRAEDTLVTSQISSSDSVLAYKVRELEVVLTKTQGPNEPVKLSVRTDVPAKTDRIGWCCATGRRAGSARLICGRGFADRERPREGEI
jgi:hypothetical protein